MSTANRTATLNSWKGEWVYALVIDRFHDGKDRTFSVAQDRTGFGKAEELRQTCGGTLNGIRRKLPYIKQLGCTSILLTPFLENNPEHYHGYAIQDFLNVDCRFGTLEELKALVSEAHALDLRVIMDVVLNHTGNNWSYKEKRTPFRKRKPYTFSHWHRPDKPQPLALRNEDWYSKRGQIVHWDKYPESWDGDIFELKDLVWDDNAIGWQVLECMVEIYTYWIKTIDVDGFRLDALKHIRPTMANAFCNRIKAEARHLGKEHFILIGEVVGNKALIEQYTELHAFFNFPFYFQFLQGIRHKNSYGLFAEQDNGHFLPVNYLDNHDQIGLEPKKRISDLLTDEQLLGCLFLMGLQDGINCLYYGTEQGLRTLGAHDHDVRECLFDIRSETELCNPDTEIYRRVSATLHLVKKVKERTNSFSKEVNKDRIHLLYYQDNTLVYRIVYNGAETSHSLEETIEKEELLYSNYQEKETDQLRGFELRVYEIKKGN